MWPGNEKTEELLDGAKAGDADAVERLLDRHRIAIHRLIEMRLDRRIQQRVDASDIVQEVMIKVWQKATAFNPHKAAASTWIYTIARNCRTDMYRRLQKFDTPISADDIWPEAETEELFAAVQQKRDAVRIKEMLAGLPHEQSQILVKVYMEGKSHSEVAEELDLPLGTVKSRVRLAMKKLQLTAERH